MPFQYLPEQQSGQFLSASYLNFLGENVAWLYGMGLARNMPFQGFADLLRGDLDATDVTWYFRMREGLTYLHYEIEVDAELDYLRILASPFGSPVTLFANETPGSGRLFTGTVNTAALTLDAWYQLWVEMDFLSAEHDINVRWLALADSATLGTYTVVSYSPPASWITGDTLDAADINLLNTDLDAARNLFGDARLLLPVRSNNTEDRGYFLWHQYRFLFYIGDGTINSPASAADDITLTGNGTNLVVYDLANVEWLSMGQLYEIEGCTMAAEDYLPGV